MSSEIRTWSRLERFRPAQIENPASEDELAEIVRAADVAGRRVKVMGAGHSFTAIAVTPGVHVRIDGLDRLHAVDRTSGLVTVGAGIRLGPLNRILDRFGLAMPNLGDIDKQSIAGAISTGTHGTGLAFGGIATQVRGLRLMGPDGTSTDVDTETDPELFACAKVGLGALGILTRVTLQTVPAFRLHASETVEPLEDVLASWPERIRSHDHVEFFFMPGGRKAAVKVNTRTDEAPAPLGRGRYLSDKIIGENVAFGVVNRVGRRFPSAAPTIARLISGGQSERDYRDVSYKVFASPRWVHFYETEWSIPLDALEDTVREVSAFARTLANSVTFPIEVRCAAGDDIPLSTANGGPRGYLAAHVYWGTPHDEYFAGIAAIAGAAGGRPHWGKLHSETSATLAERYPDWVRFQRVRAGVDPEGRFSNSHLDRVLGPIGDTQAG